MRLALALMLTASLNSCGSGDDEPTAEASARETQQATTAVVEEALPLTAAALGARSIDARGEWTECLPELSWAYEAGAAVTAPRGDVAANLDAVRSALVEAGFTEGAVTDTQVSVERDDVVVVVRRPSVDTPNVWSVFVESACARYPGDDQEQIEQDPGDDFTDLRP